MPTPKDLPSSPQQHDNHKVTPSTSLPRNHLSGHTNAAAESLNSLYKRELIDRLGPWNDLADVTKNTMNWVAWYNSERLHSHCDGVPPFEYEEAFYRVHTTAA